MSVDFSKFDKAVDLEGLKNDLKEVEENGGSGDFAEVKHGTYEVRINKLELTVSKKGDPMLSVWFKILNGEFKNSLIFMNQVITQPFQIHIAKEFLNSLDSGIEVDFESYSQFADLIMDIAEEIDGKLEYALKYDQNDKGYNTFKITDVFEVE